MNTRMIVPTFVSTVMLSTPILAAGDYSTATKPTPHTQKAAAMSPADKCTALEKQFDATIETHGKAAKANEAKTMRADGGNLCTGGKQAEGITKLEQALKDLGVKTKS